MEVRMEELLRLFDVAIAEASTMHDQLQKAGNRPGMLKAAALTLKNLRDYRESVASGKLGPSGGLRMGMSRAVQEWAEGTPLIEAVRALEEFYQDRM
jgi:hypothetical protein